MAIAVVLALLLGPVGNVVVGYIETGYEVRQSNTHLAVATAQASGAEIVYRLGRTKRPERRTDGRRAKGRRGLERREKRAQGDAGDQARAGRD